MPIDQQQPQGKPGRKKLPYETVVKAIKKMLSVEKTPTLRALQAEVGGSMGTIQEYLKRWEGDQKQAVADEATLSPELMRVMVNEISAFSEKVKSELESRLDQREGTNDELAAECVRLSTQVEELTDENETLLAKVEQQKGIISELHTQFDSSHTESLKDRQAVAQARLELAKAELRLEMVPRLEIEIANLREKLALEGAQLSASLDLEKTRRTEVEQEFAVLSERFSGTESRLADFISREQSVTFKLQAAEKQINSLLEEGREARESMHSSEIKMIKLEERARINPATATAEKF